MLISSMPRLTFVTNQVSSYSVSYIAVIDKLFPQVHWFNQTRAVTFPWEDDRGYAAIESALVQKVITL